ncbi:hypothetical protein [Prochlorococcus sp. P1361]|nr:hypothetical protein PMIT1312_00032 [Prochlorococcus marinus str. MIT 1312]NMP07139.1 hypothetical protein [Prochlorococcus sp. P1361]
MQRSVRLSLSLTVAAALALASTPIQPVAAQEDGNAADLGVMEINIKDTK